MKKLTLILSALFLSTVAFAEVKPAGTVLSNFCGDTNSFPTSVSVCIAKAEGSNNTYLALNTYRELTPIDSLKTSYVPVTVSVVHLKSFPPIIRTTYEGVRVLNQGGYPIEQKVKLVTTQSQNDMTLNGDLYFNGQSFLGSKNISLEMMFHTQSL